MNKIVILISTEFVLLLKVCLDLDYLKIYYNIFMKFKTKTWVWCFTYTEWKYNLMALI